MPIAIQGRTLKKQFLHCTCFICDHCGKPIKDASQGIVDYGHVGKDSEATDIRIYHNWFPDGTPACSLHYKQTYNSVMLDEFMEQLIHNTNYKKPDRPRL